jgi:hypothetical protein
MLRAVLLWSIQPSFLGNVAPHHDQTQHAATRVVSDRATEPVQPGLIEANSSCSSTVIRELKQYAVTVTRQEGHVECLVLVMELQLKLAGLRHYDDCRLPDKLVWRDVDLRSHHAVLATLSMGESAVRKEAADDVLVGVIYPGKLVDQVSNAGVELLQAVGTKQSQVSTSSQVEEDSGSESSTLKI